MIEILKHARLERAANIIEQQKLFLEKVVVTTHAFDELRLAQHLLKLF